MWLVGGATTGLRKASQVRHLVGRISSNFCVLEFWRSPWSWDKVVVPEVQAKVMVDEDDTPLRGMSIQLHKLATGDKAVVQNQRWSLYQT
jgi:hypothetical protein